MSLHETRGKIDSVDSIRQLTRAMEMVAASKMRRAEDRMAASRHYARQLKAIIGRLANSRPDHRHPFMQARPVSRVGYIVVASDRGLCGGLNGNAFRTAVRHMADWHQSGIPIDVCTIGNKAQSLFRRTPCTLVAHTAHLGDAPVVADLIGAVRVMLDAFERQAIDRLFLVYSRFVSKAVQEPMVEPLLPLPAEDKPRGGPSWDYLYEMEPCAVVRTVIERFVESQLYQAVVENLACEQAARMAAMNSASGNAEDLIGDLQIEYNKGRQARITQELAEIVGGSRAKRGR